MELISESGITFGNYFMMDDDPMEVISEGVDFDIDAYIAEKGPVTKKNLITRMKELLMKIFNAVMTKTAQIVSWFYKKGKATKTDDKTLDEIAAFVFGDNDTPPSKYLSYTNENGGTIRFNFMAASINGSDNAKGGVKGHDMDERPEQRLMILGCKMIRNPDVLESTIKVLEDIKANNGKVTADLREADKILKQIQDDNREVPGAKTMFKNVINPTITMEEFTKFNDVCNRFMKALEISDDFLMKAVDLNDPNGLNDSELITKFMNRTLKVGKYIQKVVNAVGDGLRQIYIIDEKWHNQINSSNYAEKLPMFVKQCIESNIPSKYVCYAIRCVCDVSVNSEPGNPQKKADVNKAQSGNGRFVMFPGDPNLSKFILKVGYNGLGIRSNRNEFMVWDKVKDIPDIANELYQITDIGDKDNIVILCQRAKPLDEPYKDTQKWCDKMYQLCKDNKVPFIIRCNDGGFAKDDNGKIICVDYGTVKPW